MKSLIVIVGPTAVGKTSLCIDLALELGTEIISADSRQVFREMSIGTAKPTDEDLSRVKHHFIDSHSIHDQFNAGDFEKQALEKLGQLYKDHDQVILTGGSGLYVKAVTEGLDEMPEVDENIRKALNLRLKNNGLERLTEDLKNADPDYYKEVDLGNPRRVVRALEVFESTGRRYSELRVKKLQKRDFKVIKIGLSRPREELYERIEQRMDIMLSEGLFEEAAALLPYKDYPALQTVGYREIFGYLEGAYDRTEAIRLLKRNSRRYAKRQLTWFGKDPEIAWFNPDDYSTIRTYIKNQLDI